jgi:hypothetical protein
MSILGTLRDNVVSLFYQEAEVARFIPIAESAGGFTIPDPESGINDRHIQDIQAPGLLDGSRPVIFLRTTHTGTPSMSVRLNQTQLIQQTLSDSGPHSWHEIVPANALKPNDNELTFFATDGSVRFSDVVIFYTSNQLTVEKQRQIVVHP